MSCCLGRTLNIHFKYYVTNQAYGQKFYSVVYPLSNKIHCKYNAENNKRLVLYDPKHLQYRKLSAESFKTFYSNFYETVTSSEASRILTEGLIGLHDVTGLPWWCTIIVATAGLRFFIGLPIGIYQQYLMVKINLTKTELDGIVKKIKDEVLREAIRKKDTKERAIRKFNLEVYKHWRELLVKNNCHPFKIVILNFAQLPIWILMSFTLRKFAADAGSVSTDSVLAALQFKVGGALWFTDLTVPDPLLILPITVALASLLHIELNVLSSVHPIKFFSRIIVTALRLFAILSFLISILVPSGVCLYWACNIILSLSQTLLLLSPRVRRLCRIPKIPIEMEKPYSRIWFKLQERFGKIPKETSQRKK